MELDRGDKLFIGSLLTAYLLVMLYVAIFQPQDLYSCLIISVIGMTGGFIGGWIAVR